MEIKSVFVYANEWHDRSAGNSYFSAETWINGKWVFTIPFSYGYGDFFVQAATARIRGFNILPIGKNESLYHFCLEHGIDLYTAKRSMRKNELAKKEMANIEFMNQLIEGKK